MIPVVCRVKHDPENGQYADCMRACVATILGMQAEQVPHFFHDNCDGMTGFGRVREFLTPLGYAPFCCAYDGSWSLAELLEFMGEQNSAAVYMLFGRTNSGNHVIVCQGDAVVHDPAWYRSPLIGPNESGYWSVMCIAKT